MVETKFVEKFEGILSTIKREKGEVYLFMIVKIDEGSEKWSVVISAPWISFEKKSEEFTYLANLIRKSLDKEELSTIARLGIFEKKSPLVQMLTKTIKIETGTSRLQNTKINGHFIRDAYVFHSSAPK